VIEVALRVKVLQQLTGQSRVPEREVPHRGIARIPDEAMVGNFDRGLSPVESEVAFGVNKRICPKLLETVR
jgi:hypothetical protein